MAATDTDVHVHSGPEAGPRLQELLAKARFAMVTTPDRVGLLNSRPLTVQRVDGDGTVWFLVDADAEWIESHLPAVNLAFTEATTWVSAAGDAELVTAPSVLEELGDPMSDTWFNEGATKAALRVDVRRADYWDGPNRAAQLFEIARAKVTGEEPDLGERGVVEPS